MRSALRLVALGLSLLVGGQASTINVIDSFDSTEAFITDAGEGLGLPPSVQPRVGEIALTQSNSSVRVDYDVAWIAHAGQVGLTRLLADNSTFYPCGAAAYVALKYRILEPQSRPGAATMGMILYDGSACTEESCRAGLGYTNELYVSYHDENLDDDSGDWRELRLGLCGSASPDSPFTRINGIGPQGNRDMDSDRLVGFQIFATAAPPGKDGVSEPTLGAIELEEMVCVEDDVDPCAVDTRKDPAARAAAARV